MNIYLIKRPKNFYVEWDDFNGFVVCADTLEEALSFIHKAAEGNWVENSIKLVIGHSVADVCPKGIVLSDYKAG